MESDTEQSIRNVSSLETKIENELKVALSSLGVSSIPDRLSHLTQTSKEKGFDITFSIFSFTKELKKKPDEFAELVVNKLKENQGSIFESVLRTNQYVQLKISTSVLACAAIGQYTIPQEPVVTNEHYIIEFSSPNTNKPLHLGHVRNNCLGNSITNILKHQGHKVTKIVLVNDRGVHICKSMLAYKSYGNGETPESSGIKGDHLVGKYYVEFEKRFVAEYNEWLSSDQAKEEFAKWQGSSTGKTAIQKGTKEHQKEVEKANKEKRELPVFDAFKLFKSDYRNYYQNNFSKLGIEAKEMLVKWENGDEEVLKLWQIMNDWVFAGFAKTYENFGIKFDVWEKESQVYKYGKEVILEAYENKKLKKFENGTIGCDLVEIGLLKPNTGEERNKALLRSNGTSVYMTQDVGTAINRLKNYNCNKMIYVVGNEQDRHFETLFKLLEWIQPNMKGNFFHLSYGMVNLPSGRMKSREGTVVDADDLLHIRSEEEKQKDTDEGKDDAILFVAEMAYNITKSKWPLLEEEELRHRSNKIALAAIKFFILSIGPQTTVLFDPKASLEFKGKAGPYLLYQYARTRSILKKAGLQPEDVKYEESCLSRLGTTEEVDVLRKLYYFPKDIEFAAKNLDPSKVTDGAYELTRLFNLFYKMKDKHQIVNCEDQVLKQARLLLTLAVGTCLKNALELCGIDVLEQM